MFDPGPGPVPDGGMPSGDEAWAGWEGPFEPPSVEDVAADEAEQVAWLAQWESIWTPQARLTEATGQPAGIGALSDLAGVDVAALSADDAVTYLQQVDRAAAWIAGTQVQVRKVVTDTVVEYFRTLEDVSGFVTPEQAACAELAAATRLSPRTSDARVQESVDLTGPWQPLLDALLAGEVGLEQVRAISRELRKAPGYGDPAPKTARAYGKACAKVLTTVIPYARSHTPGQCARRVRALVIAADPAAARRRRRQVTETEHGVYLKPGDEPGTCELTAVLPLAHGKAVYDAIDTLARDPRLQTADGCVTRGQHRTAALVALTLGDPGQITRIDGPVFEAKIKAHVDVVVPAATIAALTGNSPVDVDRLQGGTIGSEPVTADVILDLLAECDPASTLRRLVTDVNGSVLDLGRSRYAISDAQRHLITRRDRWCRHPGCARPASRCEIDHATAWNAGGRSDIANLGALCKHHHQLKTHTHWTITTSTRDGTCTWRSPLARIYEHQPPGRLPPTPALVPDDTGPPDNYPY